MIEIVDISYDRYVWLVKKLNGSEWSPENSRSQWEAWSHRDKVNRVKYLTEIISGRFGSDWDVEAPPKTEADIW